MNAYFYLFIINLWQTWFWKSSDFWNFKGWNFFEIQKNDSKNLGLEISEIHSILQRCIVSNCQSTIGQVEQRCFAFELNLWVKIVEKWLKFWFFGDFLVFPSVMSYSLMGKVLMGKNPPIDGQNCDGYKSR